MKTFWGWFLLAFSLVAGWNIIRHPLESGCLVILAMLAVFITVGVLVAMFIQHPLILIVVGVAIWAIWRQRGRSKTQGTS